MRHDIHVAYLREGPLGEPGLPGVCLHRLEATGNYDPRILWQLVRLVRRLRPDILQTWIQQMDILGGIAARMTGTRWVIREPASEAAYPGSWKQRLREWVVRSADMIVSNSQSGDRYWRRVHPRSTRCVIPNGFPLNELEKALPVAREEAGLPEGARFILYVGRLENGSKNLQNLVAALAIVFRESPVHAIFCGEGPDGVSLGKQVDSAGISQRVKLQGHVSNVWSYMKAAALFVSVSWHEGRPNAVVEAMASECPLVVSDIPAHREVVDQESALFVDPANPREIADAILTVLADPESARRRAQRAKARTAKWSVAAMAQQYESLYQNLILTEHGKAPAGRAA